MPPEAAARQEAERITGLDNPLSPLPPLALLASDPGPGQ